MVWSSAANSRASIRPATVAYSARLGTPSAGASSSTGRALDIVRLLRDQLLDGLGENGEATLDGRQVAWIDALHDRGQQLTMQTGHAFQHLDTLGRGAHAHDAAIERVLLARDEVVL